MPSRIDEWTRRVAGSPNDLALRLRAADAIEPEDADRARLIRAQCALAQMSPYDGARVPLEIEQRELLRAHRAAWASSLPEFVHGAEFRRGFVERVRADAGDLARGASTLFAQAPILHLDLDGAHERMADVCALTEVARLESLGVAQNGLDDRDVTELARCPRWGRLVWLDLRDNRVGREGVLALAASASFPRLCVVLFQGNPEDPLDDCSPNGTGEIVEREPTPLGKEVEREHGYKLWLHPAGIWGETPDRYNPLTARGYARTFLE